MKISKLFIFSILEISKIGLFYCKYKMFMEDQMHKTETTKSIKNNENQHYKFEQLREVTPDKIPNAVLARLIDEVRNDEQVISNHAYNRFHNRHNR